MDKVDYAGAHWHPSPNYDTPRTAPIRFVILHGTWMADDAAAIARLSDPAAKVSCHYMIHQDGSLTQLVREAHVAWHAGVSAWGELTGLNAHSIGIEISNPGLYAGVPYHAVQYATLEGLLGHLFQQHNLLPQNILAHSDIAPNRKDDPGEFFDWKKLEEKGLAAPWRPFSGNTDPLESLFRYGYRGEDRDVLTAFQRRYLPNHVSGVLCPATKAFILGEKSA